MPPFLLALWAAAPAAALTSDHSGVYVDVGAGVGGGALPGVPFRAGPSGHVGFGEWWGAYDDDYALGRYWSVGVLARGDLALADSGAALRLAPMLEVRRGYDLLVVGFNGFLAAGAVVAAPLGGTTDTPWSAGSEVGPAVRGGGSVDWKRGGFFALQLRGEGGVDVLSGKVSPAFAVGLGISTGWGWKRHEDAPAAP